MITYNAKDLIEQAQMLADLQNSDFISWKENLMFLDNAWTDLYQQIINHGDKSFLKTISFTGNKMELPDDFYQLYYICYNDGLMSRPITRKSKTTVNAGPYYDIVGNEIILCNFSQVKNIEMSYYPLKETITFASDDVKTDMAIPSGYHYCDCSDKYVLLSDGTDSQVIDIVNNSSSTATGDYYFLYEGTKAKTEDTSTSAGHPETYFKRDNKAYAVYLTTEDDENFVNVKGISRSTFTLKVQVSGNAPWTETGTNPTRPSKIINGITDDGLYFCISGNLKFFSFKDGTTVNYDTGLVNSNIYCFGNDIYYEKSDGIYRNKDLYISSNDYNVFNGVMKIDEKTGYGILVDDGVIKSAFTNTELVFPSNVYFTYLAYKLAVYYKVKQGADASNIAVLADDALKTFYDTLPRDENEYVRISNVYAI